jgi:hypothetical protein
MGMVVGYEEDITFEKLKIEMSFDAFCKLNKDELLAIQKWLIENAEDKLYAEYARAAARERQREVQRRQEVRQERQQKKSENRTNPGYVYLVGADNGLYKIGRAKNVDDRVNFFGVKLPMKTWLVHSFYSDNYDKAEKQLHEHFAEQRNHGEWFNLSDADVEKIKSLSDGSL